jgi:hypothetical protein
VQRGAAAHVAQRWAVARGVDAAVAVRALAPRGVGERVLADHAREPEHLLSLRLSLAPLLLGRLALALGLGRLARRLLDRLLARPRGHALGERERRLRLLVRAVVEPRREQQLEHRHVAARRDDQQQRQPLAPHL